MLADTNGFGNGVQAMSARHSLTHFLGVGLGQPGGTSRPCSGVQVGVGVKVGVGFGSSVGSGMSGVDVGVGRMVGVAVASGGVGVGVSGMGVGVGVSSFVTFTRVHASAIGRLSAARATTRSEYRPFATLVVSHCASTLFVTLWLLELMFPQACGLSPTPNSLTYEATAAASAAPR